MTFKILLAVFLANVSIGFSLSARAGNSFWYNVEQGICYGCLATVITAGIFGIFIMFLVNAH